MNLFNLVGEAVEVTFSKPARMQLRPGEGMVRVVGAVGELRENADGWISLDTQVVFLHPDDSEPPRSGKLPGFALCVTIVYQLNDVVSIVVER